MKEYNITLNENELNIIAQALCEKPYGMVCNLINNIDNQIKSNLYPLENEDEEINNKICSLLNKEG